MRHCRPILRRLTGVYRVHHRLYFSVDCTVPTMTVHCYPNNKLWVTKDIEAIFTEKKRTFGGELRSIQRDLKIKINEAKATGGSWRGLASDQLVIEELRAAWTWPMNLIYFLTDLIQRPLPTLSLLRSVSKHHSSPLPFPSP